MFAKLLGPRCTSFIFSGPMLFRFRAHPFLHSFLEHSYSIDFLFVLFLATSCRSFHVSFISTMVDPGWELKYGSLISVPLVSWLVDWGEGVANAGCSVVK